MFNFGFGDNCCLYLLIILLIICLCGNGCISGIIDKLCNCGCLLPILAVLLCCGCGKGGGHKCFNLGCGCK